MDKIIYCKRKLRSYAKKVNIDFYKICGRFASHNKKNINFAAAKPPHISLR